MITLKTKPRNTALLDLTPLIDIVFIVIVFLLLCMNSPIIELPISLHKEQEQAPIRAEPAKAVVVQIYPTAPFYAIADQRFADFQALKKDLKERIKHSGNSIPVHIASDAKTPVAPLLTLLNFLNTHSMSNTHILMEKQ
ncbi:hypothetical protein A3742_08145 [Oleiphilus sp. HI0071]|uniref:biopolymer transporter ExbD n=1 Tax=unclassified Oleiphilus TaxID=2631174 RepID=UPI0007C3356E|nr:MULTISPECIES: biopolymer transporter ExbD [unclassified Oleiphilus]KZY72578.1 hypothetical protein A3737_10750 [Oleiphilus sp. HI0065]KZY82842.1 hypothetical protein A3742_08145 [Oleiphilus sp. HI0071]KZZ04845.1 hypothetical protein A3744_09225 [Oleiphilus sp. HI0073]KZZ43852.1 hypothetical protein A3758_04525 [Oleiphilus sp. HI0118]KZZ49148.1 hypothetical protein A3760_02850 [Oleiphilus sp. HI0122]KZZ81265.1 hypothetical protein A3767_08300 [Oleiphilus sp. HI0133]